MTQIRPCPMCEGTDTLPRSEYDRDHWEIVECRDCGLIYLRNPPGYAALEEEFAWQDTFQAEHERRLKTMPVTYRADLATRWRHRIFRRPEAERYRAWFGGGNLLNVGCAAARTPFPGFRQYGIEISKELAEEANRNLAADGGFCVQAPAIEGLREFEDDFFDAVLLRSYLEHEEHPLPVLREVRRILKPTGKVYVRVPNFSCAGRRIMGKNWVGFRYPDHVNYFTPATLSEIAARAGYDMHKLNPVRLPLDDNINVLLTANAEGRA